jgi:MoCo/4Fe-4S cofactor protein with predicted Tat translocation signal
MEKQQEKKTISYWKSLDEKYQTPEFLEGAEKEFQSSPLKEEDDKSGLARRQFMKLMGASIALSSAACVRRPVQKIIPYNKRPSEVVIGLPNYYSSSFFDGREGFAVTVKTREGRPLFIKGHPDFPGQGAGLSVRGSSQLLSLYDPDRVRTPIINSQDPKKRGNMMSVPRDWESLDAKVVKQMAKGGIRILTGETPSPSLKEVINRFSNNTGAQVHRWSPVNQTEVRKAARLCYGREVVPKYLYNKAKMIVSVDADFLGTYLNPTESTRLFSEARDPEKPMSKLVSFQSVPSLTSFNADDNYSIKPSQQLPLVLGMIHELAFVQNKASATPGALRLTKPYAQVYEQLGMTHEEFSEIVGELAAHKGEGIVVAGGLQTKTGDGLSLQIAINYLNDLLSNNGSTIHWNHGLMATESSDDEMNSLIEAMNNGEVKTLIINELNPMYNLPITAGFKEALSKVEMVIVTNNWMDETASFADVVAPAGHAMENWGDNEFTSGLVTIQQPTIRPLHNTRSFGDSLMAWSRGMNNPVASEENFFEFLKKRWTDQLGSEQGWYDLLQKGFSGSLFDGIERYAGMNPAALNQVQVTNTGSDVELSLYTKVGLHDGTMANVSWLQELPDPVSKIVWDNYLVMSPTLADQMKVRDGSMVRVQTNEHSMELPVYIAPGQNPHSVAVAIGYGRSQGGDVQKGVGFNVQDFIRVSNGVHQTAGIEVKLTKTKKHYDLAQTQGHHTMEGRQIAVETTDKLYKESGDVGLHKHKIFSIWNGHKYEGHKWGMGVDLNSCTGCSACMIACQAENNIPVVGKKYVLGGREMHWIRIDRYYSGDEKKSVDAIMQPVMCQHCENAPCETVCPVLATVHSDEGLNDMVYNRCVGTRYCSNNCPYKVRRFNWFYYDGHHRKEPLHMALNPDVTVRTRGVMEKCTFCVQRIKEGKNIAKDEKRDLKDGDIKTACQEVCPTDAIVFGDLNDKESAVNKWFNNKRHYTLLEEFNAAPRVRYLAKIRNTQRDLGGGHHGGGDHGSDHGETEHKEGH